VSKATRLAPRKRFLRGLIALVLGTFVLLLCSFPTIRTHQLWSALDEHDVDAFVFWSRWGANPNATVCQDMDESIRSGIWLKFPLSLLPDSYASRTCRNPVPLIVAAAKIGPPDAHLAVETLLKHGADINVADAEDNTSLLTAIQTGDQKTFALLLQKGADTHLHNQDGKDALTIAVAYGKVEMVKDLLEQGADPNTRTPLLSSAPIHLAAETGNVEITRLLLAKKVDIDSQTEEGLTPLILAVMYDQTAMVRYLLTQQVDLNKRDKNGQTALHHALWHLPDLRREAARLLIAKGASLNIRDNKGHTPLGQVQQPWVASRISKQDRAFLKWFRAQGGKE
jgi:ankyrin repeat protein